MSRSWTPKPHFRGGRAYYKGFLRATTGLLCVLMLASCGQSTPSGYPGSRESSDTLQPLTVPPNPGDGPPLPGTTGAPKTADGLPALQVKGVNTKLFSNRVSNEADRLERLENAVQELRNDFDSMVPAIVRLVAIEGDIQALIKQLEVLSGDPSGISTEEIPVLEESRLNEPYPAQGSAPASLAPLSVTETGDSYPLPAPSAPVAQEQMAAPPAVPAPPAAGTQMPAPVAAATAPPVPLTSQAPAAQVPPATQGTAVRDVRVGEHPGKTRIVLDVSGKTSFTADLDNQERILVIEIPEAGWTTALQKDFSASPLLSSYRVEALGDRGSLLIFQIKKPATIAYKAAMDNPGGKTQRIVIDLSQ